MVGIGILLLLAASTFLLAIAILGMVFAIDRRLYEVRMAQIGSATADPRPPSERRARIESDHMLRKRVDELERKVDEVMP